MESSFYLNLFLDEGREQLQELGDTLLFLEADPGEREHMHAIFRTVHTFKSMADTMGYSDLAELTHRMEGVMELLRDGELSLEPDLMQLLLHCVDALEQRIEDVADGREHRENWLGTGLQGRLDGVLLRFGKDAAHVGVAEATEALSSQFAVLAVTAAGNTYEISVVVDPASFLRSARILMVVSTLETLGEVVSVSPSLEAIELDDAIETVVFSFKSDLDADAIRKAILEINEVVSVNVILQAPPPMTRQEGRAGAAASVEHALAGVASGDEDHEGLRRARMVRVGVEQLDILIGLARGVAVAVDDLVAVGEGDAALVAPLNELQGRMGHLRQALVVCRELPFEAVFSRFPRMVEELAEELGKWVNFEIAGEELPCDRLLLDELSELVVHLLRNSLDHGLETPAAREANGKTPQACLRLAANSDDDAVQVVVSDDGRGIDPARVLASAIGKGLVTEAEGAVMSREAILDLILQPGFSTASETTRISGRGIGMDAVKAKVESLGGGLKLTTELGRGCVFTLSFPRLVNQAGLRASSALSLSEMSLKHGRTVRVNGEHLDSLGLIHQAVVAQLELVSGMLGGDEQSLVTRIRGGVDRLGAGLKLFSQAPFDSIFARYPRMVRELAHELGKQVNFEMTGGDYRYERAVMDEINDLVIHLLRNSLDHGLEAPAERVAAGKVAAGALILKAERSSHELVLSVQDDGRGIDHTKVLESAIARGLLTREEGVRLSQDEVLALITQEGLSTATQTTRLSGRGVGLDVVKAKVEALGGRFQIATQLGFGSTFSLRLPSEAPTLSMVG